MRIDVLTLFPEMFAPMSSGVIGRALEKGVFTLEVTDIRAYSKDKHMKTDDYPFGGGAGMVMTPQPLHDAITAKDPNHTAKRIFMSPKGETLSQELVIKLSKCENLMFVCGHYEGVDQRIIDTDIDMELSIGDYVLTGGELAAMVGMNAVLRYVNGVLGSGESTAEESFSDGLLEYPQYTRPHIFNGLSVPDVLLSGNHAEITKWRKEKQLEITAQRRPDLLSGKSED